MSKELDYLDDLLENKPLTLVGRTIIECIKEKIQRLEAIDNSNPSEALVCFENMQYRIAANISTIEYTTIKQALLKAQEPKKYLKWEDLEFKGENFPIKVKVGNTEYLLCFHNIGKDQALTIQNYDQLLCTFYLNSYYDKQFFNDLRLERVKE